MQTFLPYPDFDATAKVLDMRRLGKQRVEGYQILKALRGESKGWVNHPATKMWRGYESMLIHYTRSICLEWIRRGYRDSIFEKVTEMATDHLDLRRPKWLGEDRFHLSHQSNLVRKMPEHYGNIFDIEPDLPYYWPLGVS